MQRLRWAGPPDARPFVFLGASDRVQFAIEPRGDVSGAPTQIVQIQSVAGDRGGEILRTEAPFNPAARDIADLAPAPVRLLQRSPWRLRFAYIAAATPKTPEIAFDAWDLPDAMPVALRLSLEDPETGLPAQSLRVSLRIEAEAGCAAPTRGFCSRPADREGRRGGEHGGDRQRPTGAQAMTGGRDGFIVVAVLAVLALLTGLLGSLSLAVRGEIDAVLTASEQVRLEALTQAAAAVIAYELYELKRPAFRVTSREIRLDEGTVQVTVEDEAGKVDLNGSDPVLLAGLYRAVGLAEMEPEVFAANVVAWRQRFPATGANRDKREPGFGAVSDLRWLPNVSAADAAALSAFVTVHNPGGKIAPATAPETVLYALPGLMPPNRRPDSSAARGSDRAAGRGSGAAAPRAADLPGREGGTVVPILMVATTNGQSRRRVRLTTVKAAQEQALFYTTAYEPVF